MLKRSVCTNVMFLLVSAILCGIAVCPATWADDEEWLNVPIADPGFEKIKPGPVKGPHWTIPPKYGPPEWASISSQRAKSGSNSLRLADDKPDKAIFVRSQLIKAAAGVPYRASVFVFNEKGTSRIYLEFFDEKHKRIAHTFRQASVLNKWTSLEVELTSPLGIDTVDIGLYSTIGNTGVAFYDDCSLQRVKLKHPGFPKLEKGETAMDIGSRLQLFVDGRLIDKLDNLKLKANHPIPREIVLRMERSWEGVTSTYPVVLKDGKRYRMWYRAEGPKWDLTAYSESKDGIHWERPSLGLVEFNGSKDNNLIWPTKGNFGVKMCVFIDGNPGTPPSERYKATVSGPPKDKGSAQYGLGSSDGIHWKLFQPEPLLVAPEGDSAFDSHNMAFWDEAQSQYVAYLRGWRGGKRGIRRSTSKDFKEWTPLEYVDFGNTPSEHLYTNAVHPYFRNPHFYIMLPSRFVPSRRFDPNWPHSGISDIVLITSRDGLHFDRTFMDAYLRPGLDPNNWTDRGLYPGPRVVPTGPSDADPPREMSFYYTENYRHPSNRLRRAVLRTDGFACVHAKFAGGEFVTKPIIFSGKKLIINYSTSAVGSVRVEIQNVKGKALPMFRLAACGEIYGDKLAHAVTWTATSDVSECEGKPIRLRFVMKDADLYSLRFGR